MQCGGRTWCQLMVVDSDEFCEYDEMSLNKNTVHCGGKTWRQLMVVDSDEFCEQDEKSLR